jgi:PIN domain nuclease of toxin-antitoxin system
LNRLLLDTHVLIWTAQNSPRLSAKARELLDDPQNELSYSVASLWEIGIKFGLRREDFLVDPDDLRAGLISNEYQELPIFGTHALFSARLPNLHKDPFDRLLVAQAMVEGQTLVTADPMVAAYSPSIMKI